MTPNPTDSFDLAVAHFRAGRLQDADRELSRLLSLSHITQMEVVEAFLLRGSVRMASSKPGQAVQDWKAILLMDPDHKAALEHLYGNPNRRSLSTFSSDDTASMEMAQQTEYVVQANSNTPLSGRIKVTKRENGATVGYVSFGNQKYCKVTKKLPKAITVTASSTASPFVITVEQAEGMYPYLGFTVATLPDSSEYLVLTRTGYTAPHDPPMAAGNLINMQAKVESSIWSYDQVNHILTPHWVNPDSTKRKNNLCYSPHHRSLFLPASFDEAKKAVGDVFLVNFTVE